jgi:hypothetical protein
MVLYSRLHLIIDSPIVLRVLLFIILGVGFPLQIFVVVAASGRPQHEHHYLGENVFQVAIRLDLVSIYFEIILSTSYVYLFSRFMRNGSSTAQAHLKHTLLLLIFAEGLVVATDVAVLTLWYLELYLLRLALGPFFYAVKLKVEFNILNRITSMGKRRIELKHISISAAGDETSMTIPIIEPAPLVGPQTTVTGNVKDEDLETVKIEQSSAIKEDKTPLAEIENISTSAVGLISEEERHSFDAMERQYLGRF